MKPPTSLPELGQRQLMPLTLALVESFGLVAGVEGGVDTAAGLTAGGATVSATIGATGADEEAATTGFAIDCGAGGGFVAGADTPASTTRAPFEVLDAGAGTAEDDSTGAGGGAYWLAGTSSNMLALVAGDGAAAIVVAPLLGGELFEVLRGMDEAADAGGALGRMAVATVAPFGGPRRNS